MSSNIQIHDIVITEQLSDRSYRNRNADLEKQAFQQLAKQSSYGAQAILNALCDLTLSLCNADSSGVSLLQVVDGEDGFYLECNGRKHGILRRRTGATSS